MANHKIRILLADSLKDARDGLQALLQREPDMEVAAKATDGESTVRLSGELQPNVVVIDTDMPDLTGLEVVRRVIAASPDAKVLVVALHSDSRYVVRMLESGAFGYLLKERASEDLSTAVHAVAANRTYVSPGIAGIVKDG